MLGSQAIWSSTHNKPQSTPVMEAVRDHIGNVPLSTSGFIGGVVGAVIAQRTAKGESVTRSRLVAGAFAGAVMVGALLNGLTELKYGQSILRRLPTEFQHVPVLGGFVKNPGAADPADFAIGTATAAAATGLVYTKPPKSPAPQEIIPTQPADAQLVAHKLPVEVAGQRVEPGYARNWDDLNWNRLLEPPKGYEPMQQLNPVVVSNKPAEFVTNRQQ